MTAEQWRRRWRAVGLGVDRLFPVAYGPPAPRLECLHGLVPNSLAVPGEGRRSFDNAEKELVKDGCVFGMKFIAEFLPGQVVCADAKPLLPEAASRLAVRCVDGGNVYVGSVDLIVRLAASRSQTWNAYDDQELALDFKATGAETPLGVNGPTMRGYIENMRRVMLAARREHGNRVGLCAAAGFLVWRPPGPTFSGAHHRGAYGFVAYDVERLVAWDPKSSRLPDPVSLNGKLLVAGRGSETGPDSLPTPPPPARPPARDRWGELQGMSVRNRTWVTLQDFVRVFSMGRGGPVKRTAQNVHKRLQEDQVKVEDYRKGGVGRPLKIARVRDLRRSYPNLA